MGMEIKKGNKIMWGIVGGLLLVQQILMPIGKLFKRKKK